MLLFIPESIKSCLKAAIVFCNILCKHAQHLEGSLGELTYTAQKGMERENVLILQSTVKLL